jgi:hypothetical protein
MHYHGYVGMERETVGIITDWIKHPGNRAAKLSGSKGCRCQRYGRPLVPRHFGFLAASRFTIRAKSDSKRGSSTTRNLILALFQKFPPEGKHLIHGLLEAGQMALGVGELAFLAQFLY